MSTTPIPIFIDGAAGTTGLLIEKHLDAHHPQFEILKIDPSLRKDEAAKRAMYKQAECVVLCLPDEAAKAAASLADAEPVRLLDASSAHRVAEGWTYGMAELNQGAQRQVIREAERVSNPGCYASCAVLMLHPLIAGEFIGAETFVPIFGVSGFSGGGNAMIAQFEDPASNLRHGLYSLQKEHKHVKEIKRYSGLQRTPHFVPSVGNFKRGMVVTALLSKEQIQGQASVQAIAESLQDFYKSSAFVNVFTENVADPSGMLMLDDVVGTNKANIYCFENQGDLTFVCHLDNLGKGASLAAVQNLNIMFGFDEEAGLSGLEVN